MNKSLYMALFLMSASAGLSACEPSSTKKYVAFFCAPSCIEEYKAYNKSFHSVQAEDTFYNLCFGPLTDEDSCSKEALNSALERFKAAKNALRKCEEAAKNALRK